MDSDRLQKSIEGLYSDAKSARDINSRNLKEILSANADTIIGKKFGFSSMHSEGDFLQGFPLSDYSDYKDLLSLMFNEKKEGVLTRGRPYCFFLYVGQHGKPQGCAVYYDLARALFNLYNRHAVLPYGS